MVTSANGVRALAVFDLGWITDGGRRFLGLDTEWIRHPRGVRTPITDGALAGIFAVYAFVSLETTRSLDGLADLRSPVWMQVLWLATACGSLVLRRTAPLTVMSISLAHLVLTSLAMPELEFVTAVQVYYYLVVYSTVAWTRRRRFLPLILMLQVAAVATWFVLDIVGRDRLSRYEDRPQTGLFSSELAAVLQVVLNSSALMGIAAVAGAMSWHSARRYARIQEQAAALDRQADLAREQAVVGERLRIARELHDVVGHYVAVIGIQAGAARRVVDRSPDEAKGAMSIIERISRSAARDMQLAIGTLRTAEKRSEPTLDLTDIPALLRESEGTGVLVDYEGESAGAAIPPSVATSIYRCVQESLTNVHRHSTARRVLVSVQVAEVCPQTARATLRVVDDGAARTDTAGSRVGQVGMRDRTSIHGGTFHAGPLDGGGYAVEATFRWKIEDCDGERTSVDSGAGESRDAIGVMP
ncbi:sensor histidine kinase [Rhodococcus sp. NPDC078407]|uniref:sensor histidine kinase n=1 Tax=Rhodococcus sp. NPDC078407 TaxID=3364509 RepID=UPI0037CC5AB6